jgi:hypothetical protein
MNTFFGTRRSYPRRDADKEVNELGEQDSDVAERARKRLTEFVDHH